MPIFFFEKSRKIEIFEEKKSEKYKPRVRAIYQKSRLWLSEVSSPSFPLGKFRKLFSVTKLDPLPLYHVNSASKGGAWPLSGPYRPILEPFWDWNRVILGWSWTISDRSGVTLGSFWHRIGIILGSLWCRFDPILRPFWVLFGPFWAFF